MNTSLTRALGLGITVAVVAAVVALLNVTPASTAAAACKSGSSGGGQSTPSATPSPSPSESEDDDPLPIPTGIIPDDDEDETPSPTPSSTQPPGESGGQTCPTTVSIKTGRSRQSSTTTTFKGNVKSPEADCERGRKITLKKKKKGRDANAGTDVSKRAGSWKVRVQNARGRYYAVAAKSRAGTTTCKPGESKAIRP